MAEYALSLVTPPASEPVSLTEAKAHLRLEITADDAYVGGLISAARAAIETRYSRQMVTATYTATFDGFPGEGEPICLPLSPLRSVTSIEYEDTAGDTQTLDPADYVVVAGREPSAVYPAYATIWPYTLEQAGVVRVTFTAGHGTAADVPAFVRQAILLLVGHWYERRELIVIGRSAPVPLSVEWMLQGYADGRYY